MGYIDQNLMNGEKVMYQTRLHWVVFFWPAVFFILVALGVFYSLAWGGILFVVFLGTALSSFVTFASSEFGVTNKRVLIKVGFIRRHTLETLLTKVEGIGVDQDILGRILGYGTIVVSGTGGTREVFHKIDAPLKFRKHVQEQTVAMQEARKR